MQSDIFKGIFDRTFTTLGDRMKAYEKNLKPKLSSKTPVIIRLDGKAFHTYTKSFNKPFDEILAAAMKHTTQKLCEEIQNVKIAYSQSDEITLLLSDLETETTQQWFKGDVQKMVSVSASVATYHFNDYMNRNYWNLQPLVAPKPALFDSRIFNIPRKEIVNCFIWRQQDAVRNSVSALAQSVFSAKELHRKSTVEMNAMLSDKGIKWSNLDLFKQRGFCVTKEFIIVNEAARSRWAVDDEIPIFSEDRSYIEDTIVVFDIEEKLEKKK